MGDVTKDRAGTAWDWPVGLIVGGLLLLAFRVWVLAVPLLVLGVVALLIRRGAFTPRR